MRLIDADKLLKMIEENIKESGKHRMAVLAEEVMDVINDYAEDYESEEDYQRGLNDAWEAARKVYMPEDQGGLSIFELNYVFDVRHINTLFTEFNAKEVIEKLHTYEAEKKAKEEEEEIKVGDEVETDYTGNVIIAEKPKDGWYATIAKNFARYSIHESHIIKKTGRHFPQVAELLNAMKEDGETNA